MGMPEVVKWIPFVLAFLVYVGKESFALFTPVDNYLVACGSSHNITFQGRTFIPDSEHPNLEITSQNSVAVSNKSNAPSPVYQSARLFYGYASYKFRIEQQGRHWIRLYFHPFHDLNHNLTNDLTSASITVVTDTFVLINNYTFMNYNGFYLFKEYAISITSHELSLTFIPQNNSLVFVNAIEVVSIPDELFPDQALALNPPGFFNELSTFALETVYRVNVGGASLSPQNDSLGRSWENDDIYLSLGTGTTGLNISTNTRAIKYPPDVTPDTAPSLVYATAKASGENNLSWVFSVDPNFQYLVRVHFCDIISKSLDKPLVFNLFINEAFAIRSLDLLSKTKDLAVPYYNDFVSHSYYEDPSKGQLSVSVGPDTTQGILNAIMNGMEIMKISNEMGSLDGFSSLQSTLSTLTKNKTYKTVPSTWFQKIWIIIGCSVCVLTFLVFLGLSVCYLTARRSKKKSAATFTFLRSFTFHAIQQATNDFDQNLLVGKGGFGKVYKGTLENGKVVAIKVANPESRQGLNEFHNEIELLCGLRHQNLVSLIGCCSEDSEMILVYKYMANGSFCSHLYGTDFVPLSWKQRLEICIGAAKGLYHLHTGAEQSIIHRDVKAANILLDENFVAKVADFGISKKGPPLDKSHVTTNVKGSFGYVDPEYFRTKFLTKKSDVYSFGVVLIEVICGKPALDDARPTQQMNLAMWALCCHEKGTFHEMMDPYLIGKVNMDSLNRVSELAWKCLEEKRVNRPPMGYVLCELEEALHLELASQVRNGNGDPVPYGNVENGIKDDIENVA